MSVKLEIEGFASLNQQLGEAEDKVRNLTNQFGSGSKQVEKAAREAGRLKQQMIEADRAIDSFTRQGKFDTITTGIQGVVGGFAAVQGAMAVIGVESEDLQRTLLRVQGALAMAEGIRGVTEFAQSFGALKTAAVSAFTAIKGAIGSTGIGLLIVGIGVAIQQLTEYFGNLTEAQKKNKEKLEDLGDQYDTFAGQVKNANDELKRNTEYLVAVAQYEGKSLEEIAAIKKKASQEESANIADQLSKLRASKNEQIKLVEDVAKAEGKSDEEIAALKKNRNEEIEKEASDLNNRLADLENERNIADIQLKKAVKDRDQKAADDAEADRKEREAKEIKAAQDLEDERYEIAEKNAEKLSEKAKIKLEQDLKIYERTKTEELSGDNLSEKAKFDIKEKWRLKEKQRRDEYGAELLKIAQDAWKVENDLFVEGNEEYHKMLLAENEEFKKTQDEQYDLLKTSLLNSSKTQKEIQKELEEEEIKNLEDRILLLEGYRDEEGYLDLELSKFKIDLELELAEKKRAIRDRELQEIKQTEAEKAQIIKDFTKSSLETALNLQQQYLSLEINNRKASLQSAYEKELKDKKLTAEGKADLDYKLALEMEKLNEEQFENEKKMNIARAIMTGAEASMNAYAAGAKFGPVTAAAFAALSALFTGAQIAMISAQDYVPNTVQKPGAFGSDGSSQYAEGGLLTGPSHDMGGVKTTLGELEGGEFVMNRRSTANFLPLLQQMNTIGNSGGPELATSKETPVIKTYVVASEMTNQQEANSRIKRLARF